MYVYELGASSLPSEFVALLPETCDYCGAKNEITETLTELKCSNPSCGEKSVHRLVSMLKDLDVKNMGESKCRQFLEHFDVVNPYAIFMYEPIDGVLFEGCSMDFSQAFYEQLNGKRKMLLWEYVKIGNLPGIQDSARKLLSDYDDLHEFYDDLESGGIPFVQELLDIKAGTKQKHEPDNYFDFDNDAEETVSIKAVKTYNTLIFHKEELFQALDFIEIKQLTTPMLNLCISTAVGKPYKSKKDFINSMNEEFSHKIHLNFLGSVSKECQFLIWSKEGAPTTKVKKAYSLNEKRREYNSVEMLPEDEGIIQVLTGAEFREYLESL